MMLPQIIPAAGHTYSSMIVEADNMVPSSVELLSLFSLFDERGDDEKRMMSTVMVMV